MLNTEAQQFFYLHIFGECPQGSWHITSGAISGL